MHASFTNMSDKPGVTNETASLPTTSEENDQTFSGVPSLPKGAAMPAPFGSKLPPSQTQVSQPQDDRLDSFSPPSTPSQRLLDADSQPQYANYPSKEKSNSDWEAAQSNRTVEFWVPYPLRPWFWVPFFVLLVLLAIALEIALHFSHKNNGWTANGNSEDAVSLWHYIYTLPPSFCAMILVGLWAYTDVEIKKMQPYVDLVHGDSPPERSLLLDYTRNNNFFVWPSALRNRHFLVALSSLMVILTLSFQPLAGALLEVQDTWWQMPDITISNTAHLGLNQDSNFQNLTSFLSAAGFASASVQYSLPNPPFTSSPYTIAPFQIPTGLPVNSTILFVNTTAVKSDAGCQPTSVNMTQLGGGSWNNSVSVQGCSLSWTVNHTAELIFGVNVTNCSSDAPQFAPVVFWYFDYDPVQASATVCFPTINLFEVEINYDLSANNVTHVTELGQVTSSSNFSSAAGNLTGSPLNGRAYNGIEFNLTNPDEFVLARLAALQLVLPAAVLQNVEQSSAGLNGGFNSNSFAELSSNVYLSYLTLLAQQVYFLPVNNEANTIQVKSIVPRLFLSDVSVHLLAIAMILLAFFGTIAQLFHRFDRQDLRLRHQPGTIASAVSIGGQTGMGELLAGKQDQRDINEVLSNKKFRIEPKSMRIVMEGEEGYEFAASPRDRRKSVFAALQNAQMNKRFSRTPASPMKFSES